MRERETKRQRERQREKDKERETERENMHKIKVTGKVCNRNFNYGFKVLSSLKLFTSNSLNIIYFQG